MTKTCTHCGTGRNTTEFGRDKHHTDGLTSWCKPCLAAYQHESRHWEGTNARRKAKGTAFKWRHGKGRVKYLVSTARDRAKRRGTQFTITADDVFIPEFCPVLGVRLTQGVGVSTANSASIDRIDPRRGYLPGNIQVISKKANMMKSDASPEELLAFADWVYKTHESNDGGFTS